MSKLNDLDRELDISSSSEFYEAYQEMRSHLFNTGRIPKDELKLLVIAAYDYGEITEGKACELLNCDRLELREMFNGRI